MERDRDFDNDRSYRHRAAWKKAREAFGPGTELADLFREVEKMVRDSRTPAACPRFALTVALAAFVRAGPAKQSELLAEYFEWCGQRREREDRAKTEAGFQAAMANIFGDDWRAAA